jgi:hypothetical protein
MMMAVMTRVLSTLGLTQSAEATFAAGEILQVRL